MTPPPQGPLRVRRLPDSWGWLGKKKHYEVACFETGSDTPSWVRQTEHPGSVLRGEGVHPTDISDYVAEADAAWHGGVGPWRSAFPSENDH